MMNNKLKKFTCVALATVMTFSGLQMQPKKVQAATMTKMDAEEENEKIATNFDVVLSTERTILEGNVPQATDVKITNVCFEDGSIEETVSDISQIFVSLNAEYTYHLGENELYVTYMGCKKKITVIAEADKVTEISAVQCNDAICVGDTLKQSDFEVVARYASGKIDSNYMDYEIVDAVVTNTTENVTLRDVSGIETIVELTIVKLEERSIVTTHTGAALKEGDQLNKEDFSVILIYNNGSERVLEKDEYELIYDGALQAGNNAIEIVYKANREISDTIMLIAEPKLSIETAVPTTTPEVTDDNNQGNETAVPESTPNLDLDKENESTVAPDNTAIVPATTEPSQTPTVTPEVVASATPGAVSTTPGAVSATPVVDNNASSGQVTTGAAVTTESAVPATEGAVNGETPKTTKVSFTLGVGETVKITMKGAVGYKTSNSKILKVTNQGVVTAKKVGKAKITVTDEKGNTKICTITVKKAPKKVKVNFTKKTIKKGKKATIKVSFAKGYYSNKITFKSNNKKVATVNSKGVITAKKKGTCKITVKTYNGKKAVIKITVK